MSWATRPPRIAPGRTEALEPRRRQRWRTWISGLESFFVFGGEVLYGVLCCVFLFFVLMDLTCVFMWVLERGGELSECELVTPSQ